LGTFFFRSNVPLGASGLKNRLWADSVEKVGDIFVVNDRCFPDEVAW
jgi:hypothetical protein